MRRVLTSLSMILAAVLTTALSAPAAFAMRVVGPDGGASGHAAAVAHGHNGLAGWEIAVIVAGAAIVLFAASTLVTFSRRRRVLRPAGV